ncbi:PREDICTED: uncharacterized protein LOC107105064 [Cyprinodon variegatus]|uniref:uncharacterized protein LOC107105064 n=1 Tax=Cyprinodon variegatus TaxID=28743 RepID=UPI0007425BBC|nr:PREDICTED: uncharacterized protein LOC107105064 [Cyprinodon variegatus]
MFSIQSIQSFIMALELLFFILLNLSYEARALPQPKVEVDRLLITETDSVTLKCSTSYVNVDQCVFYIENKKMSAASSCVETLTGSELLRMTENLSSAEVKVKCFYSVKYGALDVTSSDSESTIISINNLVPPTLTVNQPVITETDSVTLDCQPPSSVLVTECHFLIVGGSQLQRFNCQKTLKGGEILSLAKRRSPANLNLTCFYLDGHQSPNSNLLTIIIQIPPPELIVNPQLITETDLVTLNCGTPSSVSVDKCFLYFITSKITKIISCEQPIIIITGFGLVASSLATGALGPAPELTAQFECLVRPSQPPSTKTIKIIHAC